MLKNKKKVQEREEFGFIAERLIVRVKHLLSKAGGVSGGGPVVPTVSMFTAVGVEMLEADGVRHATRPAPQHLALGRVCAALTLVAERLQQPTGAQ